MSAAADGFAPEGLAAAGLAAWSTTDARAATTSVLLRELEDLPAQPSAAFRVLRMLETDSPSLAEVARVVATDPALTVRVVRLANGAWFGRAARVASPAAAVAVLGLETLRWVAASAAAGLATAGAPVPPGFWAHGGATAAAASLLASRLGLSRSDAFCLGLLHNLGLALLARVDPDGHPLLVAEAEAAGLPVVAAERDAYGLGHDEAAARVLAAWSFPPALCEAVGAHHTPGGATSPSGRCLQAARALVRGMPGVPDHESPDDAAADAALRAAGVRPAEVAGLSALVTDEAGWLVAALDG